VNVVKTTGRLSALLSALSDKSPDFEQATAKGKEMAITINRRKNFFDIFKWKMLMIFKIIEAVDGKTLIHEDGFALLAPRRRLQRSEQ